MNSFNKAYDASQLGQPVPKPRFKCEHVKAGFVVAARIILTQGIVEVCVNCWHEYHGGRELRLTDTGEVV